MSTGVVKARDGLNVRKGPGTGYAKLGKLKNNTTVSLNGRQNGWYSINYSGRKGYICGTYVSVSGGATTTGGGGGGGSYTVTASSLNVRKGAGTGYGVIGCLKKGNVVSASGEANGWLKISYNGRVGWISKKYTRSGGNSSGGGGGSSSTAAKTGKVTASSLNVRKGAGTSYGVLGVLSRGASFSYTGESSGWLKISYKGKVGWISKKYTTVGGGTVTGGGGGGAVTGGGSGTQRQRSLGNAARNKAAALYSQYVSAHWTYSQSKRTSSGHYDCSSFSARSWASVGISMGYDNSVGQAKGIYSRGGEVSTRNLIPGDLLFYHNNWNSGTRWRGINHVAVYDGSGGRYDAGGTPVKHYGSIGNPVMCGRPSVLA